MPRFGNGPEAQVLAAGEAISRVRTTLPLGATANIEGAQYTVIGVMLRTDDEGAEWSEYLLYSTRANFFWLVETDDGWTRANVMKKWPTLASIDADQAFVDNGAYDKTWGYPATVRYAAGAFNWRVAVGDVVQVVEFKRGVISLALERTDEEMTWSRSNPVGVDQLRAWFGATLFPDRFKAGKADAAPASTARKNPGTKYIWWLLGLNSVPLLSNFGTTMFIILIAVLALLFPPSFLKND